MRESLALCCAILFVGCSNETPSNKEPVSTAKADIVPATITLGQDPAEHFKLFINRIVDSLKNNDEHELKVYRRAFRLSVGHFVSLNYDVRKTDSLVSPFIATAEITFSERIKVKDTDCAIVTKCKFTVPAQEGQWIYRDPVYQKTYVTVNGESDSQPIGEDEIDNFNRAFQDWWRIAATPDSK